MPNPDIVLRGGTVFDGTGRDGHVSDVFVQRGRIAAIGSIPDVEALELDVTGLFVTPGFIDVHSHSDYTLLVDPRAVSAIYQGVTLEVVGNCGHGCFPIRNTELAQGSIYGYKDIVPLAWRTAADYFERLEQGGPAVNVASLVPNGQLRRCVVGLREGPASPTELKEMTNHLEEALEQGGWGLSTGLEYAAESGATSEEIEVLCASVARTGGLYATHTRFRDAGAAAAVDEAVSTSRRAGVRLQVSHLVPRDRDEADECIRVVEWADEQGLDVAFDMHTRLFGFTFLSTVLPAWAHEGGATKLRVRLSNPRERSRLKEHRSILSASGDWHRVILLDNSTCPEYSRKDVASIAAERGQEPLDAIYDLLLRNHEGEPLMTMIMCHTEAQQRAAFAHPLSMPGSDATTLAPTGPLANDVFHGAYTWASWFYRFVHETGLLSPAEGIKRLTSSPAARLGLRDRGLLREGYCADVTVIDPAGFRDRGTVYEPNKLASGVHHVIVNGVLTLTDGVLTGQRGGAVLRRSATA